MSQLKIKYMPINNIFRKTLSIARNTFREAIRDRILYAILAFGLLFILADLFLAKISLGDIVMIKSFGLAGLYIFGVLITVFLGSSIIYKELDKRTLYFVLSKPVSRLEIVIGKFIGLFAAIFATTVLMALVYLTVIFYESGSFDHLGSVAILLEIMEEALLVSLLIFFSSFMSPMTAILSSVIIIFLGHILDAVVVSAKDIGGGIYIMAQFFSYILPNLEKFNIRNLVVHNIAVSQYEFWTTLGYAALYSSLLIVAANIIFKKREL